MDGSIDPPIDRWMDGLIDGSTDQLIDWLVDWLIDYHRCPTSGKNCSYDRQILQGYLTTLRYRGVSMIQDPKGQRSRSQG